MTAGLQDAPTLTLTSWLSHPCVRFPQSLWRICVDTAEVTDCNLSRPWARRNLLSNVQIPDPKKLRDNACCFKLSLGVNSYTTIIHPHLTRLWASNCSYQDQRMTSTLPKGMLCSYSSSWLTYNPPLISDTVLPEGILDVPLSWFCSYLMGHALLVFFFFFLLLFSYPRSIVSWLRTDWLKFRLCHLLALIRSLLISYAYIRSSVNPTSSANTLCTSSTTEWQSQECLNWNNPTVRSALNGTLKYRVRNCTQNKLS